MDRPPRSADEHIISSALLIRSFGYLGVVQAAAAMFAFYYQFWTHGYWGVWLDLPTSGELYQSGNTANGAC
jgi:hypothetical protein